MSGYSQIISDINDVSYLLQKAQLCLDLSPITAAIGKIPKSCSKDGLIGYSVDKLKFQITDIPRGTLPSNIEILELYLNIEIHEKKLKEQEVKYPIKADENLSYNFSLELEGLDDSAVCHYASWHLDFDKKDEKDVDFIHPVFHMTFGGNYLKKKIQEGNDFGHMLLLLSPRIPYPPMDLILGIDFVLRNFFKKSQIQGILENRQYQRAVKNSQYRCKLPKLAY